MYYIGLDLHKKTISCSVKDAAGHVHPEGKIGWLENLRDKEEQNKIIRCAGCQVLEQIARAPEETLEAHFALFRDWQRTQTQSSATALRSLRQQMDVRFCGNRDHQPRGKRA